MAKQDLSQMMQQRSPLVERQSVEAADLYTNSNADHRAERKRVRMESPEVKKMTKILQEEQTKRKDFQPVNYIVDKTTEPQVTKYTTHLSPKLVKALKRFALESDLKDYEVVQAAIIEYLDEHDALT